jgi:hypothetical protein
MLSCWWVLSAARLLISLPPVLFLSPVYATALVRLAFAGADVWSRSVATYFGWCLSACWCCSCQLQRRLLIGTLLSCNVVVVQNQYQNTHKHCPFLLHSKFELSRTS